MSDMANNSNAKIYKIVDKMLTCMFVLCTASALSQNQPLSQNQTKTQKMTKTDFTTTFLVDQTPKEAFNAINNPREWWSEEIEGSTDKLNDVFIYQYEDVHYCQMQIVEEIPDKRVVWLVKYNYFNFTHDKSEWTGTKIIFDISAKDKKTQVRFTHLGLVPTYECFDICSNAWSQYIQQSLFSLITTGKGKPNKFNKRVKAL